MKKFFAIWVSLLCVVAVSCSKEESAAPNKPEEEMSVEDMLIGRWESDWDNDFDMYVQLRLNEDGEGRSTTRMSLAEDYYVLDIEWRYKKGRQDDMLYITEYEDTESDEYGLVIESISEDKLVLVFEPESDPGEDEEIYKFTFKRQ